MLEVAALTVLVLLAWGVVSVAFIAVKALLWLLLLPLRFIFGIVLLPFILLKMVIGGVLLAVLGPLVAIIAVVGALAFAAAMLVPLLPLLVVGAALWVIVRLSRGDASPTTA
jgi:hypothetical protein